MMILIPRDPHQYTRAILEKIVPSDHTLEYLYVVHTDFGHVLKLTGAELASRYEIGEARLFSEWQEARQALLPTPTWSQIDDAAKERAARAILIMRGIKDTDSLIWSSKDKANHPAWYYILSEVDCVLTAVFRTTEDPS